MRCICISLLMIFISYALSEIIEYNETNSKDIFERYKKRYNRKYKNQNVEKKAFTNFIRNLNNITILNEKNKITFAPLGIREFNLNKYADQDTDELRERYAVTMVPYYQAKDDASYSKGYTNSLKQKKIEDMKFYDLDQTEDLYNIFLKKYNKEYKGFRNKQISYYRFYKTLVELNNKKFNEEKAVLTADADVIQNPGDYYFEE